MTPERRKQISRESYLRHRDAYLKRHKQRYLANREAILAYGKAYHAARPEARRKSSAKYRANHREQCRQKCREWYQRNIDGERQRARFKNPIFYAANRERVLEQNRQWRQRNQDKVRSRDLKRKALLKGATINLSGMKEWMASVKSKRTVRCYWCDTLTSTKHIHFDHIVPLSKGGPHSVENLCVSCQKCNCSKKAKPVSAWVRIGQQTLAL